MKRRLNIHRYIILSQNPRFCDGMGFLPYPPLPIEEKGKSSQNLGYLGHSNIPMFI